MPRPGGTPENLIRYPKGTSGNPSGRKKLPADVREIRDMTAIEFTRLMNKCMSLTRDELTAYTRDPKITALELMVASIVAKAITTGDHMRAEFLLNRLIGKVVDRSEIDGRMVSVNILDFRKKDGN